MSDYRENSPGSLPEWPDWADPSVAPGELDQLEPVTTLLLDQRPIPAAGLRSRIRATIFTAPPPRRRERVRATILAYSCTSCGLFAIAAAGLAGIGPFAA